MGKNDKLIWHTERRKIDDLIPYKSNPRQMTEKQVKDLRNSLERFNLVEIPAINTDNKIIAGHQRLKILQVLGRGKEEIDVRVPNRKLTQGEFEEYLIRSNKNLGEWDFDLLCNFDEAVLLDVGFESVELDNIFQLDNGKDPDDVPEARQTDIKLGDMFSLGEHKLLCGNATKRNDVERLMGGEKAEMVFTDPPYGVNYGKKNRFLNSFQPSGRNLTDIANDFLGKDELFDMLVKAFTLANEHGQDHCSYYVTAPQGGELGMMMMMMMMSGLPIKHVLIWNKNRQNFSLGRLDYEYKHEPILFTWKKTHKFYGNGQFRSSVWDINKETKCKLHPTMKPVALMENAILNSSQRNEIILDLFGGSGSTLIACEKLNRRCFMLEIDPVYVQTIIDRWQAFTGNKARQING